MKVYSESGANYAVEVLSDVIQIRKAGQYRVLQLKCLEVINHSSFCRILVGTTWEASCLIGSEAYAGWYLIDDALGN
jgi:hypothetical protein